MTRYSLRNRDPDEIIGGEERERFSDELVRDGIVIEVETDIRGLPLRTDLRKHNRSDAVVTAADLSFFSSARATVIDLSAGQGRALAHSSRQRANC